MDIQIDIKTFRSEFGISQAALAEKLGVRQATISRWENESTVMDARTRLALNGLRVVLAQELEANN